MRILVNLENTEDFRELYIEEGETVESLKYIIEAEFSIPFIEQELKYENKILTNDKRIMEINIKEDDILLLTKKKHLPFNFLNSNLNIGGRKPDQPQHTNPNQNNNISKIFEDTMKVLKTNNQNRTNQTGLPFNNMDFAKIAFETKIKQECARIKQFYISTPDELNYLFNIDPDLAEIIVSGNDSRLEELIRKRLQTIEDKRKKETDEYMKLMSSDPNDLEAQKKIEEMIKWKNIDENLQMAHEYLPESFSHIHMLYVNVEINKLNMIALVDTGAQTTIITEELAKKCGIFNLCDTRYSGIAKGVGTSKIFGVIHAAQMKIGDK